MRIRGLLATALLLGAAAPGGDAAATMTPIAIGNPSFEDDVQAEGSLCFGAFCITSSWAGGNDTGVYNPIDWDGIQDNGFNEPVPDGENVAFSNQAGISQTLAEVLQADTRYTLTVEVGSWNNPNGNPFPSQPEIQLWVGNIELGAAPVTTTTGFFTPNTLVVETGPAPEGEGEPIWINLAHNSGSSPFSQVWWDDVRLSREPASVPGPAVLPLLASTLAAGVVARARRPRGCGHAGAPRAATRSGA